MGGEKRNKKMIKMKIVNWLREITPAGFWNFIWWLPSLLAIILLPLGIIFFRVMAQIGFAQPRGEQLLFILSIFYGIGIGTVTILLVDKANLSRDVLYKAKWLARFAIVTPFLILSILFWIFSRP